LHAALRRSGLRVERDIILAGHRYDIMASAPAATVALIVDDPEGDADGRGLRKVLAWIDVDSMILLSIQPPPSLVASSRANPSTCTSSSTFAESRIASQVNGGKDIHTFPRYGFTTTVAVTPSVPSTETLQGVPGSS
jgi:hypothetical protein